MSTSTIERPRASTWQRLAATFAAFGPGAIFLAAIVGPQDIISHTAAGATHGYAYLWLLPLLIAARYLVLEAGARYVVATGESLLGGYARLGRWIVWVLLVGVFVKRHLSNLYEILLMGDVGAWILPFSGTWARPVVALASWAAGCAIVLWGGYDRIERASKWFAVLLAGVLVLAAFLAVIFPVTPSSGSSSAEGEKPVYGYFLLLLALLGTTVGSLSNLKYPALVHAKGWRDRTYLREQRRDLLLSVLALLVMGAAIQVLAANVVPGARAEDAQAILEAFSARLGTLGQIAIAVGFWVVTFSTFVGANLGYSLMAVQIYRSLKPASRWVRAETQDPAYRCFLLGFVLPPLYGLFTGWRAVWLAILGALIMATLLPVLVSGLFWLTRDRKRMGELANRPWQSSLLGLLVLAVMYVAARMLLEL